eukprot:TRINITY_DN8063_c5_g1_i1.p1 TRINITY_DN8063_c5_g1~~TRINITY_DN8063_c5_g1_i1.p1  ORF type:complete len:160 (+),score=8.43 TRINITY_DN8063_c5_g1_i1:56-481(+)
MPFQKKNVVVCGVCGCDNVMIELAKGEKLEAALGEPLCLHCADQKLCKMKENRHSLCFNYYFSCPHDSQEEDLVYSVKPDTAKRIFGLPRWANLNHVVLCRLCYEQTKQIGATPPTPCYICDKSQTLKQDTPPSTQRKRKR